MCWTLPGPTPRRSRGGRLRRLGAGLLATCCVVALASGCTGSSAPPADADHGVHIDTNTPQGLRAKQTVDMLNSDWPIGPVGVRTMAAPGQVDDIDADMDNLWWDRPITVTGIDIGAGTATMRVRNSYGGAARPSNCTPMTAAGWTSSTCR